jgi:hypothetical protein
MQEIATRVPEYSTPFLTTGDAGVTASDFDEGVLRWTAETAGPPVNICRDGAVMPIMFAGA